VEFWGESFNKIQMKRSCDEGMISIGVHVTGNQIVEYSELSSNLVVNLFGSLFSVMWLIIRFVCSYVTVQYLY
jgi:hypothetical protein